MNCANHPDRERTAFCQHCGKPLCAECVRNVGASIFCEPCLAARVAATTPPPTYPHPAYPYPGSAPFPPAAPAGPNPVLAALLGFIPGVGAMYNEQYAKGIVHLIVFAILVSLGDRDSIFGLFVAGWIFYMVIEAYHTARARRDGTPLPNPFGLNDVGERLGFGSAWPTPGPSTPEPTVPPPAESVPPTAPFTQEAHGTQTYSAPGAYFHQAADGSQTYATPGAYYNRAPDGSQTYSTGVPPYAAPPVPPMPPMPPYPEPGPSYAHRFPTGAAWLIGLGVLFLVGNTGIFRIFRTHLFGPLLIIGLGVFIFVHTMTSTGGSVADDGTPLYQWRLSHALNSSFWVFLVGVIWLLNALHILSFRTSWPLFLIAGGVAMLFRRIPGYGFAPPPQPPAAPVTSTELAPLHPNPAHAQPGSTDQEGR